MKREPKLFLTKLEYGIDDYKALDVFASGGVVTLRSVYFWGDFPPEGAFFSLVANNKSLRDVSIYMDTLPEELEDLIERVCELTDCFMKAPALQFLYIGGYISDRWPENDCSTSNKLLDIILKLLSNSRKF